MSIREILPVIYVKRRIQPLSRNRGEVPLRSLYLSDETEKVQIYTNNSQKLFYTYFLRRNSCQFSNIKSESIFQNWLFYSSFTQWSEYLVQISHRMMTIIMLATEVMCAKFAARLSLFIRLWYSAIYPHL